MVRMMRTTHEAKLFRRHKLLIPPGIGPCHVCVCVLESRWRVNWGDWETDQMIPASGLWRLRASHLQQLYTAGLSSLLVLLQCFLLCLSSKQGARSGEKGNILVGRLCGTQYLILCASYELHNVVNLLHSLGRWSALDSGAFRNQLSILAWRLFPRSCQPVDQTMYRNLFYTSFDPSSCAKHYALGLPGLES